MSDIKTVTPEELQSIKELQDAYLKTTFELGQATVEQKDLEDKLKTVEASKAAAFDHLAVLRQKEVDLSNSLQEKYGSSTIDLETGAIK